MENKLFEKFWTKRRSENLGEPKYISLCHVLEGSGEGKEEIINIFLHTMKMGVDYDEKESKEMIKYLVDISKDINE